MRLECGGSFRCCSNSTKSNFGKFFGIPWNLLWVQKYSSRHFIILQTINRFIFYLKSPKQLLAQSYLLKADFWNNLLLFTVLWPFSLEKWHQNFLELCNFFMNSSTSLLSEKIIGLNVSNKITTFVNLNMVAYNLF